MKEQSTLILLGILLIFWFPPQTSPVARSPPQYTHFLVHQLVCAEREECEDMQGLPNSTFWNTRPILLIPKYEAFFQIGGFLLYSSSTIWGVRLETFNCWHCTVYIISCALNYYSSYHIQYLETTNRIGWKSRSIKYQILPICPFIPFSHCRILCNTPQIVVGFFTENLPPKHHDRVKCIPISSCYVFVNKKNWQMKIHNGVCETT